VVVKPSKEDLIRSQPHEILDRLTLFAETVQFRVKLEIDLGEQAAANDLPDETKNEVLPTLRKVRGADVDDGTADRLRGSDDHVVVLRDFERIQRLCRGALIEDTSVDRLGHGVVNKLAKHEPVSALVEELHGVGGDRDARTNVWVAFKDLFFS
jgi:hypothetical protein